MDALGTPANQPLNTSETVQKPKRASKGSEKALKSMEAVTEQNKISKEKYVSLKSKKRRISQAIKSEKQELDQPLNQFYSLFDSETQARKKNLALMEATHAELKSEMDSLREGNPFLQEAKKVSQTMKFIMRNANQMGEANAHFESEFEDLKNKYELLGNFKALLGSDNPDLRDQFLGSLVEGMEHLRASAALRERDILWLHGTRSPAIGTMLATDQVMYPTGMLMEKKIIPLTGELGQGILPGMGVNYENISGTSMSRLGVTTTLNYASSFKMNPTGEWDYLSKGNLMKKLKNAELVVREDPDFESYDSVGVKFDFLKAEMYIGRMKVVDPDFSNKVGDLQIALSELKHSLQEKNGSPVLVSLITRLEDACFAEPFVEPTPVLQKLVNDSFPIILGSTSQPGEYLDTPTNDLDEHLIQGAMPLTEIQVAFCDEERIDQLQGLIAEAGLDIEVMSFNALKILGGGTPT